VRASLFTRAKDFGIVLDDIAITHLSFSTEFTKAVEMKQVAAQDAERAKFVVLKAEQVRRLAVQLAHCCWWGGVLRCCAGVVAGVPSRRAAGAGERVRSLDASAAGARLRPLRSSRCSS
jgi:regulator of protease activity HflC (stomatin/prohibitin superfamily)